MKREDIRNVAIIAHVDHGKTTLVDGLLKTSGIFRENQKVDERVMDSNSIEKERGITILSKNTAINYKDIKINIIDTPGHADFGGEVERVLNMAEAVVLVVDSHEGPMPQTKFVLRKAIELNLPAIICINKVDRPDQRVEEVMDEVLDLFISLDADESYLDSPFVFASAKQGWASLEFGEEKEDMTDLLDTIIEYTPAFEAKEDSPFKVLVSTTDYDNYLGRIAIGKVESGKIKKNDSCIIVNYNDKDRKVKSKIVTIYEFEGLERSEVEEASFGSIVALSGMEDINIGDTICTESDMDPIEFTKISEPTLSMTFSVNNSPFAGRDGDYVTSRHLRDRLFKEKETDVSLRVETTDSTEAFKVSGRGELHLSVLIENLRREGYEFQVSKPEVMFKKDENGKTLEPIELATIDVDQEYTGAIIEKLGLRKGELIEMAPNSSGYTRMIFKIPARGLIGYRQEFLTDTKGTGILNTEFDSYERYKGDIAKRQAGSLISFETGVATTYGLHAAQSRGQLFVKPQDEVYEGEVIGSNAKGIDIDVNVCKKKKQTNVRASAADEALVLSPAKIMSVEEMMEFVEEDELIEITPHKLRIRKRILDNNLRYKAKKNSK
ncbi:translational GTPase TypA [Anaerococcus hydrogenalis]|uniref:Large ribosomal subunit assembly factor BipA n=2 Tax=Anaerococcus hydrogenalis TaxID=33029 RepID=B6W9B0_9FIRM|nr:translational GTPase TypA [Anaerococcus hydrogenalis]EEB35961.1 GTP-binding protein TypA [Anaerococcus hydrogenalis DSM 7454]MDK7695728.1 translational GTPase TypA [Anaerococcus hydrogenalis]MDK7697449.1 translational GTPase TypA [Anaerococcus hydrogenalis]MDK7708716.1 translational GTPase TypA [Anaerococcus hydrogenalis]PMC80848.1 translational GTPase TypA [Anaerococcus hydrogenalis]